MRRRHLITFTFLVTPLLVAVAVPWQDEDMGGGVGRGVFFLSDTADVQQEKVLFRETFDRCDGTGGNDGRWSGNIASSNFSPDMSGWTCTKSYGGDRCARFGTGPCSVETPKFRMYGSAVATFRLAPWTSSTDKSVDIYLDGRLLGVFDLEPERWNVLTLSVRAYGYQSFELIAGGRLFVDDVKVVSSAVNSVSSPSADDTRGEISVYSVSGKYLGADTSILKPGIYIINRRKVLVR